MNIDELKDILRELLRAGDVVAGFEDITQSEWDRWEAAKEKAEQALGGESA